MTKWFSKGGAHALWIGMLCGSLWIFAPSVAHPSGATSDADTLRTLEPQRKVRSSALQRQLRQQRYIRRLDSLISSDEFRFVPVSMSWAPKGSTQTLLNYYYYVDVLKTSVQVHLPIVVGRAIGYNAIANFDTDTLYDRQTMQTETGWKTLFILQNQDGERYGFTFTIYNVTGEVILDLVAPNNMMRYIGSVEPLDGVWP
ncbi:MAG: hypothetical protein PHV49_07130 [Alistipes sp.]|nr:hypothetical protein [Alistipes sp.]